MAKHGHSKWSNFAKSILVVSAFSLLAVIFDVLLSPMAWYQAYSLGGYSLAQNRLHDAARPTAVVVNLDEVVPLRDRRSAPGKASDPEWANVAQSWKQLSSAVKALQRNGAKAICVDWELAPKDEFLGVGSFFDDTKIPAAAQRAYIEMLKELLSVNDSGCPVVIGADWIRNPENDARLKDQKQWFPIADATRLAASLEPEPLYMGSDAHAPASRAFLPPANEVIARRLGDNLQRRPRFGFSPYAESEEGDESAKAFWIDHSAVAPEVRRIDDVNGMVVVLASTSDNGNRTDTETVPGIGTRPGGFYHAAAIGTRIGRPLYSFSNHWAEYGFSFLLNLTLGSIAVCLGLVANWLLKLEHHSHNAHFIDFWMEAAVSVFAAILLIYLVSAVAQTRLLVPGISAALVVRVLEPAVTLIRYRKLLGKWEEAK